MNQENAAKDKTKNQWASSPKESKLNKLKASKTKIIFVVCIAIAVTCVILLTSFLIYYKATLGNSYTLN